MKRYDQHQIKKETNLNVVENDTNGLFQILFFKFGDYRQTDRFNDKYILAFNIGNFHSNIFLIVIAEQQIRFQSTHTQNRSKSVSQVTLSKAVFVSVLLVIRVSLTCVQSPLLCF